MAHGLADLILRHWVPEGSVALAGDDTVNEHHGAHVYGKGRHRDPVRSTHSYTAYRWGHQWVVLAILVRFPFANRPWALPVLVALYRSREWNQQHRRRHRTPAQVLRRLVAVLLHWFPHRHFTLNRPEQLAKKIAELNADRPALVKATHKSLEFARQHTFERTFWSRIEHLKTCSTR